MLRKTLCGEGKITKKSFQSRSRNSFTLIELIIVIALLGILAAVAIPKYIDVLSRARKAADDGYLAGLRSETLLLYASNVLYTTIVNHTTVTNYWPTRATVITQMSETYTFQYYLTTNYYDFTNGTWTAW